MRQNAKRLSSMILALLLIVGAFIIFFDLIQPAYSDLQMAKGEEISQETLIKNEQHIVDQVQALLTSFQTQNDAQQAINQALPDAADTAGALAQIYGLAANSNLNVQGVAVATTAPTIQNNAGSTTGTSDPAAVVKPYGTISFTLTMSGSYESLKSFLTGLQNNLRIFDVGNITLSSATQKVGQDSFSYSVTAQTYYQAM